MLRGECVSWADCCPSGIPGCDGQPDGYPFPLQVGGDPSNFRGRTPTADE